MSSSVNCSSDFFFQALARLGSLITGVNSGVIISGSGLDRKLAFAAELATTVDASMLGAMGPRRVDLRRPPSAAAGVADLLEFFDAADGAGADLASACFLELSF